MLILEIIIGILILVLAALAAWRVSDVFAASKAWARLAVTSGNAGQVFDPAMVADLPESARRYFAFTIAPGTPIRTVADIRMTGELGLGTKAEPKYNPMSAHQILAPPHGLVWRLKSGPVTGSDGILPETSWTRFWLFHLVPIVRTSNDPDHHRSAYGRVVSEAAFWVPASLLPSDGVAWEARGLDTARVTLTSGSNTQWVDITVRSDGAPVKVVIDRWSSANADAEYRFQPFGGTLSDYREFEGYRLPTGVEGGNLIGTEDYFPFFKARVASIVFL